MNLCPKCGASLDAVKDGKTPESDVPAENETLEKAAEKREEQGDNALSSSGENTLSDETRNSAPKPGEGADVCPSQSGAANPAGEAENPVLQQNGQEDAGITPEIQGGGTGMNGQNDPVQPNTQANEGQTAPASNTGQAQNQASFAQNPGYQAGANPYAPPQGYYPYQNGAYPAGQNGYYPHYQVYNPAQYGYNPQYQRQNVQYQNPYPPNAGQNPAYGQNPNAYGQNSGYVNNGGVNNAGYQANTGYQAPPNYRQPGPGPAAPPVYGAPPAYPMDAKSAYLAGLLAILLGTLGVHNFYLGEIGKGVAQLLLTLLASWICGLGVLIAFIWSIVEGIQLFSGTINYDGDGYPLKKGW